MSEKRYNVPDGMIAAAEKTFVEVQAYDPRIAQFSWKSIIESVCEAVLRYQAENPVTPSPLQMGSMAADLGFSWKYETRRLIEEWQRRAYLVLEPEIPEAIKALLEDPSHADARDINNRLIEAYKRGKEGK